MKPSCTAIVMSPTADAGRPALRCRSGITALPANHSEVAANCEITGYVGDIGLAVAVVAEQSLCAIEDARDILLPDQVSRRVEGVMHHVSLAHYE